MRLLVFHVIHLGLQVRYASGMGEIPSAPEVVPWVSQGEALLDLEQFPC